jgi:hypothetical protein
MSLLQQNHEFKERGHIKWNSYHETKEFSSLEPDIVEHKFYASGIGNVQTVDANTGKPLDLIRITTE